MLVIITSFSCVLAENSYKVGDASSGEIIEIESFETIKEADTFFNEHIEEYDNLVILHNDEVIRMEYGVVEFISESCTLNNNYSSNYIGSSYLNSCTASEAAYLSTDSAYECVYFKISDDIGKISINNVKLVPYETIKTDISTYQIKNNYLYHNIKTSLSDNYFAYNNRLDFAPNYLKEGKRYYSYDGHYFYDDFKTMIDDYNNDTFDNSINNENVYYNYYMYLPHRSYTNYDKEEIDSYYANSLHINGKVRCYDDFNNDNANDVVNLSQFYEEFDSFFGYENIYGVNAMMMLSVSTHESSFGKSYLAFEKNNLFNHTAYDSDEERNASRFNKIDTSVYSHAKYFISKLYANIYSDIYYGSFLGNKKSGMNTLYSSDPYWSEKVVDVYFGYDEVLGLKDKDAYSLGIINDKDTIRVYKDDNLSSLLFSINNISNYSFILLEELNGVYKVQVDPSFSNDYLYDPEVSIGFIDSDIVDIVINDELSNREYDEIYFDLDDGEVIKQKELTIKTLKGKTPTIPKPYKEGYEFISYDKELSSKNDKYKALYKEINNVSIANNFNNTLESGDAYNLKEGKILVEYTDGTNKKVEIDSNMIESFNNEDLELEKITINYNGFKIDYPYTISNKTNDIRKNIDDLIYKNTKSYKEDEKYDYDELMFIKNNIRKTDYKISFKDIRNLDKMLLEDTRDKVNYTFKDSLYDVSISGLALGLDEPKPLTIFKPFKDTHYVEIIPLESDIQNTIYDVAKPYGFEVEDGIRIKVKLNLTETDFINPIIIQVKLKQESHNKIYTVYHLEKDGNITKCNTTWSNNYVSFISHDGGDFLILSKEGINSYDLEDIRENISIENSDPDNHLLFIEGSIFVTISLFGFIMIIIHAILKKKEEGIWNDYKKSLQGVESPQEEKRKNWFLMVEFLSMAKS